MVKTETHGEKSVPVPLCRHQNSWASREWKWIPPEELNTETFLSYADTLPTAQERRYISITDHLFNTV